MYKRILSFFSALVLCAGFTLGSLSFMPKSFAIDDYQFDFFESDIPSPSHSSYIIFAWYASPRYLFTVLETDGNYEFFNSSSSVQIRFYSTYYVTQWRSDTSSWSTFSGSNTSITYSNLGSPVPYRTNMNLGSFNPSTSFSYSFKEPDTINSIPKYWDYMPFYFPQLPYGYFDGHINSLDGSFHLDLGTLSGTSSDGGTYSLPSGLIGDYSGDNYTRVNTNDTSSGDIFLDSGLSSTLSTTGTWSANSGSGSIQYQPSYNETFRFRTWAVVSGTSYCYFVCDTRNTITGSLESVSGDTGSLRFSAVGADSVHYPFFCIEFYYDGTKFQTLSALPNGFTVNFKGGTLEQDQDTGIWSCDPLYHGFWLSDGCPPVVLSSLTDESYKWLANPVFGEEAFTLNFLNAINESINNLNQSVTSSISNQTSTFQNMDAPSNFDPTDVNNMLEYGSLESDFQAPSTDDIFSIDSGTFTDGMGFWRDRMNELLFFSGSPALPMTIFSLTLGLAVLIIGRRVSGGGAA